MIDFNEIRVLALSGKTLQAIKNVKNHLNIGLKESKDLVERLVDGSISPEQATIHYQARASMSSSSPQRGDFEELRNFITSGKKLQAIKALKERTKLGLKDCKELVEDLEAGFLSIEELPQKISEIKSLKETSSTTSKENRKKNTLFIKSGPNYSLFVLIGAVILLIIYYIFGR